MTKNFKHYLTSFAAVVLLAVPVCFTSCLDDDDVKRGKIYDAVVTVCPASDGVGLVVNDTLTIKASNLSSTLCGKKEVRALTRFMVPEGANLVNGQAVEIIGIDTMRTKPATQWTEEVDKTLGKDPIGIIDDWMTVAEDGYLTLHVSFLSDSKQIVHGIHLLKGCNPENPYELELRHSANGDIPTNLETSDFGGFVKTLVAFDIKDILPGGVDKEIKLTVRYKNHSGNDATLTIPCRGLGKRHLYFEGTEEVLSQDKRR